MIPQELSEALQQWMATHRKCLGGNIHVMTSRLNHVMRIRCTCGGAYEVGDGEWAPFQDVWELGRGVKA